MTTIQEASKEWSHAEEKVLVERAQRGDREAMRRLVDEHKERLYSFIARIVGHHQDAEEICQEAFLKAFSALRTFSTEFRFSTWLFTIGYRVCLNTMRRRKPLSGDMDMSAFERADEGPQARAVQSEEARVLKDAVWSAVEELTTAQRAAVMLYYRHEQSCQDIARVMQVPTATVKSHLHRARARLRDLLEQRLGTKGEMRFRMAAG